jgi:hypothetical protein
VVECEAGLVPAARSHSCFWRRIVGRMPMTRICHPQWAKWSTGEVVKPRSDRTVTLWAAFQVSTTPWRLGDAEPLYAGSAAFEATPLVLGGASRGSVLS